MNQRSEQPGEADNLFAHSSGREIACVNASIKDGGLRPPSTVGSKPSPIVDSFEEASMHSTSIHCE